MKDYHFCFSVCTARDTPVPPRVRHAPRAPGDSDTESKRTPFTSAERYQKQWCPANGIHSIFLSPTLRNQDYTRMARNAFRKSDPGRDHIAYRSAHRMLCIEWVRCPFCQPSMPLPEIREGQRQENRPAGKNGATIIFRKSCQDRAPSSCIISTGVAPRHGQAGPVDPKA